MYYEDYEVGLTFHSASVTLTEAAIIDFGMRYDPQPFHVDPRAAERSHFGGLIASGWQVGAIGFRLLVDAGFLRGGGMGAPGLDDVKWLRPVRPGDSIRSEAEVLARRPSKSRTDRGYVDVGFRVLNQNDEPVMTYRCTEIIARRGSPDAG